MNKIASLKPGDDGVLIEALINHVVSGKTNGAHRSTYLSMTLQDDTGSIDAKLWNASEEQVQTLVKGSVVQIKGDVIKYNEDRQMKIVKIHLASQDDKERIKFLKQAPLDSQFMINEIKKFIDQIDNLKLHQLVKTLFEENIEKYSVLRTSLAVERADVCILMIDANEGVTEQDTKIAGLAHESGKGVIIAINKWDEYEKENGTLEQYTKDVYNKLAYLSYAPIIFISAKTGQRVEKIFNLINEVANNNAFRISTSNLNELLAEAVAMVQPPTDKGRRLKIFYMTQVGTKPPTFAVFVNSKKLFHFSYERYLVNKLREEYGFKGTPIRMLVREKIDKDGD